MGNYSAPASSGGGTLTGIDDQSSSNDDQITITDGAVVINEDSDVMEFRVETNTNANMLVVDALSDCVAIGHSSPSVHLSLSVAGAVGLSEISTPTATSDTGAIYTKTDNNFYFQDGAGNETVLLKGGQHSIWVPAEAISPRSNAGCAQLATTAAATVGRPDIRSLAFDKSSDEHAQFTIAMPKMWNEGTINAQFYWTSASSNLGQTCAWGFQGVSLSDADLVNTAFGTAVVTTDVQSGFAKSVHISAVSSSITIAGSPAAGDLTCFQIFRDTSADNLNEDALLLGIKIFYTIDSGNDA